MILTFGSYSRAQVNLQEPRPTDNAEYTLLYNSTVSPLAYGKSILGVGPLLTLQYNYLENGLSMVDAAGVRSESIVDGISTLSIGSHWEIARSWAWGFNISGSSLKILGEDHQMGIGDLNLYLEKEFLSKQNHFIGMSLTGTAFVPTGEKDKFLSNGSFGYGAILSIEKLISKFSAVINAGYIEFEKAEYRDLNFTRQFFLGGGLGARITNNLFVSVEGVQTQLLGMRKAKGMGEAYLGLNYKSSRRSYIVFGGSSSLVESDKSSNIRLIAALKFFLD